jgi:hypothetical protein
VRAEESSAHGGELRLRVGDGSLWLREVGSSQLRRLEGNGNGNRYRPAAEERDFASVFRDVRRMAGTDLLLAHEYRHQHYRYSSAGDAVTLLNERGSFQEVQLFAMRRGAAPWPMPRFLGIWAPEIGLELDPDPGEAQLVAIGNDGSVGRGEVLSYGRPGPITVFGTGNVQLRSLLPTDGRVVLTKFVPVRDPGGPDRDPGFPFHRYASTFVDGGTVRGLPAGRYEVNVPGRGRRNVTVEPGETTEPP